MKRLFSMAGIFLAIFLFSLSASAQTFSNVTATVKDPLGNLYVNCTYSVDFVGQAVGATVPYTIGGTSPFQQSYAGAKCDSSAVMTIRIPSNTAISPTPSQWRFSICSSTGVTCFTYQGTISGSPVDLTAALQAVAANLPGSLFPSVAVASLNGIYFSSQAAGADVATRVNNACATATSTTTEATVVIPPSEPTGTFTPPSTVANDRCIVIDLRRTGGFNDQRAYETTTHKKGITESLIWMETNSVSPTNQTFYGRSLDISNPAGGRNTGSLGAVNKSNYSGFDVKMRATTPGQHSAVTGLCLKQSAGDCQAIVGVTDGINGSALANGDEGVTAIRGAIRQTGSAFTGRATSVSNISRIVQYDSETNEASAGAGARWLLNTTTGVVTAGTAAMPTSGGTTVTGTGTAWAALAGTSYCFAYDQDTTNQSMEYSIPVSSFTDNTHLELAFGYSTQGSGADGVSRAYHLYKCLEAGDFDITNNIISFASTPINTFAVNDNLKLPASPLWFAEGIKFEYGQRLLTSASTTAFGIGHTCNSAWCVAGNAMVVGGNFKRLLEWNSKTIAPSYGIVLANGDVGPGSMIVGFENSLGDGTSRKIVDWTRHTAIGGALNITFLKNNPTDELDFSGVQIYKFVPSNASGTRLFTIRTTGDIPIFQVDTNGPGAFVNNGTDFWGNAGNQTNEKWRIAGATGLGKFAGGVSPQLAGNVKWTTGAGAPVGACTTGSLYTDTAGGAATTLYVCETAAWVAK